MNSKTMMDSGTLGPQGMDQVFPEFDLVVSCYFRVGKFGMTDAPRNGGRQFLSVLA